MKRTFSRVAQVIAVLVIVSFGVTALANLVPGSPATLVLGANASKTQIDQFNHQYGFDLPLFDRYWRWLDGLFHGTLGQSVQSQQPVLSVIKQALPVTLELAIITMILSLLLATALALIAVLRPEGIVDRALTAASSMLVSVPAFISAVVLVYVFAIALHLLPPSGWVALTADFGQNLQHAVLPVLTMSSTVTPLLLRVLRGDLITVLQSDYIASARASGLPEWYVLLRHAFRPAAISLITISGLVFGYLFGGSIIVETFYQAPGLGLLVSSAELGKDIPVVQGVTVIVAFAYVLINIAVDGFQTLLDPRVKARVAYGH